MPSLLHQFTLRNLQKRGFCSILFLCFRSLRDRAPASDAGSGGSSPFGSIFLLQKSHCTLLRKHAPARFRPSGTKHQTSFHSFSASAEVSKRLSLKGTVAFCLLYFSLLYFSSQNHLNTILLNRLLKSIPFQNKNSG